MDFLNFKNNLLIIVVILLIGLGGGYFLNTKNKTLDANKTSNSQTTISQETSTSSQQSEIENLKKEVEALKNSRPNTVIKEVPKSESGVASIVDCRV